MERVPWQAGAFDPHRGFADTAKDRKLTKAGRVRAIGRFPRDHLMKLLEKSFRFGLGLPLHAGRHHGGGSFGNCTARAFKTNVPNHVSVHLEVDGELVSAQRVMPFRRPVRACQLLIIAGLLAVIEYDLLIELPEVGHQANTSLTL